MKVTTQIKATVTVETTAYIHEGKLKTHPCELYGWWGNETCKEVDFNSEISGISLSEGKYKVTVILEKVED